MLRPMMLYRSLVVGLLGACLFLVARPHTRVVVAPHAHAQHGHLVHARTPHLATRAAHDVPTLIDVSSRMALGDQLSQVRIQPGETMTSFDHQNGYIDIGLRGPSGERRVLVLEH